jgi:uncharacterized protein YecT (DUF1311 family)
MKTLFLLLALTVCAFAQGTPAEFKEAKAKHAKADAALNAAYKAALAKMDEAQQKELRDGQRGWIEYRDRVTGAWARNATGSDENLEKTADYWDIMAGVTEERTAWLESYTKELPKGFTGEWSDSYGGHMVLEEGKDGVEFSIDVARGNAPNLGEIEGTAAKAKVGAIYLEKVPKDEQREPCKLTFALSATGDLTVTSENADPFHGHNAHFDGTYRKIGKLKKDVNPKGDEGKK